MVQKYCHFEGDENYDLKDWGLNEGFPDSRTFFNGWFHNKSGKFLEAGCGVGKFMLIFSNYGFKVTGVEISPQRVEIAKKNLKKYGDDSKVIVGDVVNMPFKNNSFDYLFCQGVVEHFPQTQQALYELNRVLKVGGEAMISVPNRITVFRLNKNLQQIIGIWRCGYEQSFTRKKFTKMLKKAGFELIDINTSECSSGKRYPIVGRILRILDKPLFVLGIGGHFNWYFCKKIK